MSSKLKQLKQKDVPEIREKLLKQQNYICPICKKYIENPVLDHHHVKKVKGTGQIRGVICRTCNVFLGKMENNCIRYNINQEELPSILRNMAKHLSKKQKPYIHPSEAPKIPTLTISSYNKLAQVVIQDRKYKMPEYPKSGKTTKRLSELFEKFKIKPKYYK